MQLCLLLKKKMNLNFDFEKPGGGALCYVILPIHESQSIIVHFFVSNAPPSTDFTVRFWHIQRTGKKGERMSKTHSPTIFNGEADNFYDPNFTLDINKRMRVPKSIRVSGDYGDEDMNGINGSGWNQAIPNEKFEMNVPDRILVVGQEQHIGTKAPPREMTLENAVMPPEPGMVRVQTPPRILTLDDHYFPAVDEDEPSNFANSSIDPESTSRSRSRFASETQIVRHVREETPMYNALDVSLPPTEEIQHLRRQVGKLNRRVMAVELEMIQRQQRDKIIYAITITYFILKAFSWLTRN